MAVIWAPVVIHSWCVGCSPLSVGGGKEEGGREVLASSNTTTLVVTVVRNEGKKREVALRECSTNKCKYNNVDMKSM